MKTSLQYKKGFTLVEVLIYIGGLVIILSLIAFLIMQLYGFYHSFTQGPRVDRIGISVVDIITKDLRTGSSVNVAASALGIPQGFITINLAHGIGEKYFGLEEGRVVYTEGGVKQYLTPTDITVSKLSFNQIITDVSVAVQFELEITYEQKNETKVVSFPGLAVLRQSYE